MKVFASINLVFQVPGPFFKPDHNGVFAARYVKMTHRMLINVAVPADLTFEDVPDFFRRTMRAARDEAARYLAAKRINVDSSSLSRLTEELERSQFQRNERVGGEEQYQLGPGPCWTVRHPSPGSPWRSTAASRVSIYVCDVGATHQLLAGVHPEVPRVQQRGC